MCNVEWCNSKPVESGKGYCRMHYDQIREYGTTTNYRPRGKRNEYISKGEYTELHILDCEGNTKVIVKVDNDKVDILKQYSFSIKDNGYVRTKINEHTIHIHQLILGKGELEIDHINRDKLDNRVCNLRYVEHCINASNKDRTEDTNIRYDKRNLKKRWYASYSYMKRHYSVGYFATKEEALYNLNLHREKTIKG